MNCPNRVRGMDVDVEVQGGVFRVYSPIKNLGWIDRSAFRICAQFSQTLQLESKFPKISRLCNTD